MCVFIYMYIHIYNSTHLTLTQPRPPEHRAVSLSQLRAREKQRMLGFPTEGT